MNDVWSAYRPLLDEVEAYLDKTVDSEVALINQVVRHTIQSGGKRIRPLLVILASQFGHSVDKETLFLWGTVIEFIHTATLLHDDVIDNAEIRRGIPSARSLWGNKASIISGDYLYSLAIRQASLMENRQIHYILASTCQKMSEGEAIQLTHHADFDLPEATYLQIIEYKTASLLSVSCQLGGIMADLSEAEQAALGRYGLYLGIAFQVADDLLDYTADREQFGKPIGSDLQKGQMTLPLLHFIWHCTEDEKKRLKQMMASEFIQPEALNDFIGLMRAYGSIRYTQETAIGYANLAQNALVPFPPSPCRDALINLADYVVHRGR